MSRFAAHYIFTGSTVLKKAVIDLENDVCIEVSKENAMAIEFSNTIFFNGIICPAFTSYTGKDKSNLHVISCPEEVIPFQDVKEDVKVVIRFDESRLHLLFELMVEMQSKGWSLFQILQVLCVENYKANGQVVPYIAIGHTFKVILLTGLDLSVPQVKSTSSVKKLN